MTSSSNSKKEVAIAKVDALPSEITSYHFKRQRVHTYPPSIGYLQPYLSLSPETCNVITLSPERYKDKGKCFQAQHIASTTTNNRIQSTINLKPRFEEYDDIWTYSRYAFDHATTKTEANKRHKRRLLQDKPQLISEENQQQRHQIIENIDATNTLSQIARKIEESKLILDETILLTPKSLATRSSLSPPKLRRSSQSLEDFCRCDSSLDLPNLF
jgi:hypothetical protein